MLSLFDTPQFRKEKEIYNYIIRHANDPLATKVKGLLVDLESTMKEIDKGHVELSTQRTLPIRNDESKLKIQDIRKKLDKLVKEFQRKNPSMDIK